MMGRMLYIIIQIDMQHIIDSYNDSNINDTISFYQSNEFGKYSQALM